MSNIKGLTLNDNIFISTDLEKRITNLEKIQNIMQLTISSDQILTCAESGIWDWPINFDTIQYKNGNLLSHSNNGIKIGSGIKTILISASVLIRECTCAFIGLDLYKNDKNISNIYCNMTGEYDTTTLTMPPFPLEVKENDVITATIYMQEVGNHVKVRKYNGESTFLTVQVLN